LNIYSNILFYANTRDTNMQIHSCTIVTWGKLNYGKKRFSVAFVSGKW